MCREAAATATLTSKIGDRNELAAARRTRTRPIGRRPAKASRSGPRAGCQDWSRTSLWSQARSARILRPRRRPDGWRPLEVRPWRSGTTKRAPVTTLERGCWSCRSRPASLPLSRRGLPFSPSPPAHHPPPSRATTRTRNPGERAAEGPGPSIRLAEAQESRRAAYHHPVCRGCWGAQSAVPAVIGTRPLSVRQGPPPPHRVAWSAAPLVSMPSCSAPDAALPHRLQAHQSQTKTLAYGGQAALSLSSLRITTSGHFPSRLYLLPAPLVERPPFLPPLTARPRHSRSPRNGQLVSGKGKTNPGRPLDARASTLEREGSLCCRAHPPACLASRHHQPRLATVFSRASIASTNSHAWVDGVTASGILIPPLTCGQ